MEARLLSALVASVLALVDELTILLTEGMRLRPSSLRASIEMAGWVARRRQNEHIQCWWCDDIAFRSDDFMIIVIYIYYQKFIKYYILIINYLIGGRIRGAVLANELLTIAANVTLLMNEYILTTDTTISNDIGVGGCCGCCCRCRYRAIGIV